MPTATQPPSYPSSAKHSLYTYAYPKTVPLPLPTQPVRFPIVTEDWQTIRTIADHDLSRRNRLCAGSLWFGEFRWTTRSHSAGRNVGLSSNDAWSTGVSKRMVWRRFRSRSGQHVGLGKCGWTEHHMDRWCISCVLWELGKLEWNGKTSFGESFVWVRYRD